MNGNWGFTGLFFYIIFQFLLIMKLKTKKIKEGAIQIFIVKIVNLLLSRSRLVQKFKN